MEILRRLKERLTHGSKPEWEKITTDAAGFYIGSKRFDWAQVTSISAFKRDMLTFDDV